MADEKIKIQSTEQCNCEGTQEEIKEFQEKTGENCWCVESGGGHGKSEKSE
jgi:hypothetical protein